MAATYTIVSASQDGETLITAVEYDFDGVKVSVKVPHFQPQTKADVEQGILNRAASEARRLSAAETCKLIVAQIETGVTVEVKE